MKFPRLLFITAALFFISVGTASAAPCWKTLLNDWYDGRIDKTYDAQCYRDAIKHLPPDVEVYSNAKDDLKRALQNVINHKPPNLGLGGGTGKGGGTGTGSGKGNGPDTIGRNTNGSGPVPKAIKDIGPKNADSVPIPLLVLGGLALLLIAAGAAGVLAKRLQGRGPRT